MPKKRLTALTVEKLKGPDKGQVDYFDTLLPAFGLRVSSKGTKTYFAMLRVCRPDREGKKLVRMKLGRHGLITLEEARNRARAAMRAASEGEDPTRAPRPDHAPKPRSFGALAEEYFKAETAHQRRGKDVEQSIRQELAHWWEWPIDEISR